MAKQNSQPPVNPTEGKDNIGMSVPANDTQLPEDEQIEDLAKTVNTALSAVREEPSVESPQTQAENAREQALRLEAMVQTAIIRSVDNMDISYAEKEKTKTNLISNLRAARFMAEGNRAYERKDFEKALTSYQKYSDEVLEVINDYKKEELQDSYDELLRLTVATGYYRDGKEFESDAIKNPSLSDEDCQTVNENLKAIHTPNIREKIAYGILKIIELHKRMEEAGETDEYDPSPFMHTLEEALCEKLYLRYLKNNELSPAYKGKSAIDDNHLHFYSTLNTELDSLGVDFFYVIDGAVFKDGQSRVIMVDITLDSLAAKLRKKSLHGDKIKYATVLSFDELEMTGEFVQGEPKFLVAACNADRRNPLDCHDPKDTLEYKLTMAAEGSESLNDKIIILADACAKQIVLELDNVNEINVLKKELRELKESDPRSRRIMKLEDEIALLEKPGNKPEFGMDKLIGMAESAMSSGRRNVRR